MCCVLSKTWHSQGKWLSTCEFVLLRLFKDAMHLKTLTRYKKYRIFMKYFYVLCWSPLSYSEWVNDILSLLAGKPNYLDFQPKLNCLIVRLSSQEWPWRPQVQHWSLPLISLSLSFFLSLFYLSIYLSICLSIYFQ